MLNCDSSGVLKVILLIKTIINLAQYAVPIILILISMIDIIKLVLSGKLEVAKTISKIGKRILLMIFVFLMVPILNFILNVLGQTNIEAMQCWVNANEETIAQKRAEEEEKEKEEALKRQYDIASLNEYIEKSLRKRKEIVWNKKEEHEANIDVDGFPYYNQGTEPWKSVPFCGRTTVGYSGCGATSLSMIFQGLTQEDATPKDVANWMCANGHSGGAMPDSMALNQALLNRFHVRGTNLWARGAAPSEEESIAKMIEYTSRGNALLVLVPGHFVAVIKGKEKDFKLLDPGSSSLVGEYNADELYEMLYNYKGRCSQDKNCGVKAVWAYEKE